MPKITPTERLVDPSDAPVLPDGVPCVYAGIMEPEVFIDCPATCPRSAKLLGAVEWAWSPANNRLDTYYLSSNRARTHWILWKSTFDEMAVEDGPLLPYAYCARNGLSDRDAAPALLMSGWQGESADWVAMECEPIEAFHRVSKGGLLTKRNWLSLRTLAWQNRVRAD